MTIFNYTVNYVDVGIVAIILLFFFWGYAKGILISIVNFIRYAIGLPLCFFAGEYLSQPIYDNLVKQKAMESISNQLTKPNDVQAIIKQIQDYINNMPDMFKQVVDVSSIDKLTPSNATQYILNNVFEPVAILVIKVILFVLVFLLFFGITGIIIHVIRKAHKKDKNHKTPLKVTNKLLGGMFGLLKIFIILFAIISILSYIISLNVDSVDSNQFIIMVKDSSIYNWMDSVNPFNAITGGLLK